MRFRVVVSASFLVAAGVSGFVGCGIPSESTAGFTSERGGDAGRTASGGSAGSAQGGGVSGGKAGSSAGGKGGGTTGSPCSAPVDCDDANDCTTDACTEGRCAHTPALPGSSCDTNRDRCDGVGRCQEAACVIDGATKIDKEDGDLCTDDFCDPVSGAVKHEAKVKPSDSTACSKVTCDPATGQKVTKDLSDDGKKCTEDECDLSVGPINPPKQVGDPDPCTLDKCTEVDGVTHTKIPGCTGCKLDSDCDDGNLCHFAFKCTIAAGAQEGACGYQARAEGDNIDSDGTKCNGVLTCIGDKPVVKNIPKVDDGHACTDDSCDAATGAVTNAPKPGCIECASAAECPDTGSECKTKVCENGVCGITLESFKACDDTEACTKGDLCVFGECIGKADANPTDGNACTTDDTCTEPNGVVVGSGQSGCSPCSDGDLSQCPPATEGGKSAECVVRVCNGGACARNFQPAGTQCGDAPPDACTPHPACDATGSCIAPPRTANCCTTATVAASCPADLCRAAPTCSGDPGTCQQGALKVCADQCKGDRQIQKGSCKASDGSCQLAAATNCGWGEVCDNGECVGCDAGTASKCASKFCSNAGLCCPSVGTCGSNDECRPGLISGCPGCVCATSKTCGDAGNNKFTCK